MTVVGLCLDATIADLLTSSLLGAVMTEKVHKEFREINRLDPETPGYVIAALAVKGAPKSLSGQIVPWNGEEVKDYQKA